jgi:hypothetical protein
MKWMLALLAAFCMSAQAYGFDISEGAGGLNILGFSQTFQHDEDVVNRDHYDMIGIEYCHSRHCGAITSFTDHYGNENEATTYHYRHPIGRYIKVGAVTGHIGHMKNPLFVAGEAILHYDGVGVRFLCVPESKSAPAICIVNFHMSWE